MKTKLLIDRNILIVYDTDNKAYIGTQNGDGLTKNRDKARRFQGMRSLQKFLQTLPPARRQFMQHECYCLFESIHVFDKKQDKWVPQVNLASKQFI